MTEAAQAHILLVDDDDLVLAGLKRVLRPLHLPVLLATTAAQAAQHLGNHQVGVIVCEPHDSQLAAFLIDAMVRYPQATRIILTGYPDMASVLKAVNEAHPFKLLTKPWAEDELCTTVQQALAKHHMDAEHDRQMQEYQNLRTSTERAHAYRALAAITQAVPDDLRDQAVHSLAVGALLLRNGFVVEINPAAQRILQAAGDPAPLPGTCLDELCGLCAELELAARATPLNGGTSARTSWRSSQGVRLDYFVRQLKFGTLITFAGPP